MTAQFWITTIAIVVGPIMAVLAARFLEKRDQERGRRLAVFRDLMATRQITYSRQHVGALNLVELEFYGDTAILNSYRELMKVLSDEDRWNDSRENEDKSRKLIQDMNDCRAKLLNRMALSLNYHMSDIELMRGGYYPELLGRLDDQRVKATEFVVDLAGGKRAVPIAVIDYRTVDQIRDAAVALDEKITQTRE